MKSSRNDGTKILLKISSGFGPNGNSWDFGPCSHSSPERHWQKRHWPIPSLLRSNSYMRALAIPSLASWKQVSWLVLVSQKARVSVWTKTWPERGCFYIFFLGWCVMVSNCSAAWHEIKTFSSRAKLKLCFFNESLWLVRDHHMNHTDTPHPFFFRVDPTSCRCRVIFLKISRK